MRKTQPLFIIFTSVMLVAWLFLPSFNVALAAQTSGPLAEPIFQDDPIFRPAPTDARNVTPPPNALKGSVMTLKDALEIEKQTVDWYSWYMQAREYLALTGGLRCREGTMIKFYKAGQVRAVSTDPYCVMSAVSKRFPLPNETMLEVLLLPTRSWERPPASREELLDRLGKDG